MTRINVITLWILLWGGTVLPAASKPDSPARKESQRLYLEGYKQFYRGEYDAALRSFNAALEVNPMLSSAYYGRGQIFFERRQYERAIREYDQALQDPNYLDPAIARASANWMLHRYAETFRDLDVVIKARPPKLYPHALNQRAWFYSTIPDARYRNGHQAVSDATTACRLWKWKVPFAISTLAAAYAESGDFASAVKYMEQAIATDTSHTLHRPERMLALFRKNTPWREDQPVFAPFPKGFTD